LFYGSNADEMNDFYDKLGRPETPDDYDFDIGAHDQEGSYNAFRESAHKHGLTDAQAEGMYKDGDAFVEPVVPPSSKNLCSFEPLAKASNNFTVLPTPSSLPTSSATSSSSPMSLNNIV
jgi:hypothetical protein